MENQNNQSQSVRFESADAALARIVAVEKPFEGYRLTLKQGASPRFSGSVLVAIFFVLWFLLGAGVFLSKPVKREFHETRTGSDDLGTLLGLPRGRR